MRALPQIQGWTFVSWSDAQASSAHTRKYARMALIGRLPHRECVERWLLVRGQPSPTASNAVQTHPDASAQDPDGTRPDRVGERLSAVAVEVALYTVLARNYAELPAVSAQASRVMP